MKLENLKYGLFASAIMIYAENPTLNKETSPSNSFISNRVMKVDSVPKNLEFKLVPLLPEQSLAKFIVPEGYHMELVASEPMITEPVAIAWDGNAKMYVAQMETYTQDTDGTGTKDPKSRVMLLEDTNSDGKMDKSSVFIKNMVLPRMLLCVNHELLVNETEFKQK